MNLLASELHEQHKAHGPDWLRWLAPFIGQPNVSGLELGTFKGESAEWFLEHVFTDPTSCFACVDTFEGSEEHKLGGIDCSMNEGETRFRLARFDKRVGIFKCASDAFLRVNRRAKFQLVYVDAAHDAMNVLRDAVLAFDLLVPGGVMIFDDYEWKVMQDEIDCPKLGIDSFLACYARRLEVIGMGWQVAVRKLA